MEACLQCHRPIKSPHARLVEDSCGHKKCRLCLMKDEDGCCLCTAKDKTTVIKKEPSGKNLPIPPAKILRRSQRKALALASENSKHLITFSTEEKDSADGKSYKHKKKHMKDSWTHESEGSVSLVHRTESNEEKSQKSDILTDDEDDNRQNDSNLICCEEVDKEKCDIEVHANLPDSKVDCEETEITEVKLERKRKPMIIASHITVTQGNPTMYTCTVCVKTFKRREHVRYHNFCATGDKPFKCDLCDQSFASKSHFECHHLNHTGARPFVCETCNRGFRQKDKLTRHVRIHTGERPYVCQDCGKGFIASHSLKTHQRTHTGEKPYLCPQCGRGFTETANLQKHLFVHTGEANFMCEGCGKSFGHKWGLIIHQRTHSRERPHNCHICSRAFTNKKDLRRHFSVHSDTRPFKCLICDTAFRRKDNLERHMKNTHPETRLSSLALLNKNYTEQSAKTSIYQQDQMATLNDVSNNPCPTDTVEKISDNIYKQITQQEAQMQMLCMTTVPYSGTRTQHTASLHSSQFQGSSCIKSISRPVNSETAQTDNKLTENSTLSELTISRKTDLEPQPDTRATKGFKKVLDPDSNMNTTSFKEMLTPDRDASFTDFKETLATKLLDPVRTTNITSFRDMLGPVHGMSIANFKEISNRDTNVASFKEMLDPVRATSIFSSGSLFQEIPEAKQKSQAVPVINRPITPSQQNILYGRTGKTNLVNEKAVTEGTNCVPTITKTSNVLNSSVLNAPESGHRNVLTIVSASTLKKLVCKKSRKIVEDSNKDTYSELADRTFQ